MSSNEPPSSSLYRQLLRWLLGPLLVLLIVNGILGYRVAINTANEAHDRLLLASAKAIADRVALVGDELTVDIPYVALELFESNIRERIFYKVSSPDGSTLTGYDDLPPPPAGSPTQRPAYFLSQFRGESLYQIALSKPLYAPTLRGMVLVQVGETGESRNALTRRILYETLLPQGMIIAVAALLLVLGTNRAVMPLRRLRDSILRRPSTDLSPIDDSGVQSEVRPLIEALNAHTSRIDRMIAQRVDFVADATHQIRTRLSVLRTQLEYGQRLKDLPALRDVVASAGESVQEASRFFDQLLVLAHAEARAVPGQDVEPVDIAALAHTVAIEWVVPARQKRINLAFEGLEQGIIVQGHGPLLRELIANVLDNAVRYTHDGGAVTLRARTQDDEGMIEVEDNGPGIPESERSRVFERFYRTRTAIESGEGSGLGLAIAGEIGRSQQVDISLATATRGAGLLVTLRFRLAKNPASDLRTASIAG